MHQVKVHNNKHAQPTEFPQHRVEKPQSKFHLWGKSEPHLLGASPQQCAGVIWASNVSVSMTGKSGAESKVSEVRAEITCWDHTDLFGCWGKSSASLKRLVNNSLSRKPLTFFGIAKCLNFISIYLEMLQQGSDPHTGLLQCSPPLPPVWSSFMVHISEVTPQLRPWWPDHQFKDRHAVIDNNHEARPAH